MCVFSCGFQTLSVLKIWLKAIPLHPLVATVSRCSGQALGRDHSESLAAPRAGQPLCEGSSPKCFSLEQSRQSPVLTLLWGTQHLAVEALALPLPPWQVTSSPGISVSLFNSPLEGTVPLGRIAAGLNEINVGKVLSV